MFAPACISPQNDRLTLGRVQSLEAFSEQPPAGVIESVGTDLRTMPPVQPSIVALTRENWEPIEVLVPVDGTAHQPIYVKRVQVSDRTARQRRRVPTALSALEGVGGSTTQQQVEALANVAVSLGDLLLLVPRLGTVPPWTSRYSPGETWERYQPVQPLPAIPQEPPPDEGPYAPLRPAPLTP